MDILDFNNFKENVLNEERSSRVAPDVITKALANSKEIEGEKNKKKDKGGFLDNISGLDLFLATKAGEGLKWSLLHDDNFVSGLVAAGVNFGDSPDTIEQIESDIKKRGDADKVTRNLSLFNTSNKNAAMKPDSSLLPSSKPYEFQNKEDIKWKMLHKTLEDLGYASKMDFSKYNFIAIRNTLENKKKSPNHFIDLFVLMSPKRDKKVYKFEGTTVPGPMYMAVPFRNWYIASGAGNNINRDGLAILQPGVYDYKLGKHKGYSAIIQSGKVDVDRYKPEADPKNCNFDTFSPGGGGKGQYGINIHRAKKYGRTDLVNSFSGGCLVFKYADGLQTVLGKLENAGQDHIKLALINSSDLKTD